MESIGNIFNTTGLAIKNFFIAIWKGIINFLEKLFPKEFSGMIVIVILIILFFILFRYIITRKIK